MPREAQPQSIDFEALDAEGQAEITRVRQAIVHAALHTYIRPEIPPELDRDMRLAARVPKKLSGGKIIKDPVELLKLTGMNEEEIRATGIITEN